MKTVLALVLFVGIGFGQNLPPLPNQWFGAGAAYNASTKPAIAGWASYAHLMSGSAQTYSFTSYDVTSLNPKTFTAQSSVRTGLATVIRCYKNACLLGYGDLGVAVSASNLGGAFSGGGIGVIRIGKSQWTGLVAARVIKTSLGPQQAVYEIGVGRMSK